MIDIYLTLFVIGFLYAVGSVALMGLGHLGVHLPFGHGHGADGGLDLSAGHGGPDAHGMHLPGADAGHVDVTAAHGDSTVLHHGNGPSATAPAKVVHGVSPLNLAVIMTFLLGFGGAGYVLTAVTAWSALLVGTGAAAAGLAEATVVYALLSRLLRVEPGVLRASDADLVGTLARVSMSIRAGGLGEIVYTRLDSRHAVGARSADGQAIDLGAEVVVTAYERGTAVVEPWEQFAGGSG